MSQANELTTFEQVERYVDELDAQQNEDAQHDISGNIDQVCKYYIIVKPILNVILMLPLIPEKFKKPIRNFMSILDTFCP